jgi:copper chaperone
MQYQWHLLNIRCQGCAKTIRRQLAKLPQVTDVSVDPEAKLLSFSAPEMMLGQVEQRLKQIGYVRSEQADENDAMLVARSVVSCVVGKLS